VRAVDPSRLVSSRLRVEGGPVALLGRCGEPVARHAGPIYVAAAGKAAGAMARTVADMLGVGVRGDAVAPEGSGRVGRIAIHEGGHPLPTEPGLTATAVIWQAIGRSPAGTLILVLLSGGASALLVRPVPGLTLGEKALVTARLLASGASIAEMNVVRKHLSAVKGGGLARRTGGRPTWALILSDVIGDDVATIGSGPTAPDPSTYADAMAVVARYGLGPCLPASVIGHLREGVAGHRHETPKPGDVCFRLVRNEIVGGNSVALEAAASCSRALGFTPVVCNAPVSGETTEAAARFAVELVRRRQEVRRPTCILAGGETTVRVRGAGRGGRNQEFALAAALVLDGIDGVDLLSAGTDGVDGPTDAAGAFANGKTVGKARARGIDGHVSLATNDSYGFFDALGALFRPGPTGTNVMDIKIALLNPTGADPAAGA